MKFFVACSSKEYTRAKALMTALEERGHTVTCDWTKDIVQDLETPYGQSELERCAVRDGEAVEAADVFLMICTDTLSKGSLVELGIAMAGEGREIGVIGKLDMTLLYNHLVDYHFDNEAEALEFFGSVA